MIHRSNTKQKKVAPNLFTQLLTVHGITPDNYRLPLAFGLLPGKRQEHYTNLLEELDRFGPFHPDTALCDYEAGLRNSVTAVWPGTTLRGCYFHFKQALWRNFARSDLVPEYQVVGSFQRIGALPFIPPGDVHYAWQTLRVRPILSADMDVFTLYFESTWMGTPNRPARFDHLSWNQYDCCLTGLPRSLNLAEG
ncbi:uncharacterized protein LOC134818682 [Bolinopsis microptera]|uniref:uncharacterized protein LOC134818682 n=1 Tax=Bolinopsis microptera TaxID=2820187 RepID=UPI003078B7DB